MEYIFTLDLGGTYMKFALIREDGNIVWKDKEKTPVSLEDLLVFITNNVNDKRVSGIAISSPGAVSDSGVIFGGSAIPYIHGPNIKELVSSATGLPVQIENDANCAALAEVWKGNAKGKRDVAVVVLGTGIGGALIKDGFIHKGAHIHGGEFGYMVLNPADLNGDMRTFSEVASTNSIVKRVATAKNADPLMWTGEAVFQHADEGDEDCIQAIAEFYRMLAIGLYNIQYIYDPEIILLGGGISSREDILSSLNKEMDEVVKQIAVATITPDVKKCHFVEDANLIGAVYHFWGQGERPHHRITKGL